jgi:hypothetical protein
MRWTYIKKVRKVYRIFDRKSERKVSLGRSRQVVKFKLSLVLNEILYHADVWRRGGIAPIILKFFTLALEESEWSVSRPGRFTPRQITQLMIW